MEENKRKAQERWDEKAGIVPKTYKVDKKTAEEFKERCKELKLGQGPTISKLMQEFLQVNK